MLGSCSAGGMRRRSLPPSGTETWRSMWFTASTPASRSVMPAGSAA
jgi:hypothetical protein